MRKRNLLTYCFLMGATAQAQFVEPTIDRQSVTTDSAGAIVSPLQMSFTGVTIDFSDATVSWPSELATDLEVQADYQPLDADLTAIAASGNSSNLVTINQNLSSGAAPVFDAANLTNLPESTSTTLDGMTTRQVIYSPIYVETAIALRRKLWGIKNNGELPRISILSIGDSLASRPGISLLEVIKGLYPETPDNEPSSRGYFANPTYTGTGQMRDKFDYSISFVGTYHELASGDTVTFPAVPGQIYRIPYVNTADGGTLRVQISGVDESGYTAVDTSLGGETATVIVIDKGSIASRSITLIADSGTVKVFSPFVDFDEATGNAVGYYSFGSSSWDQNNSIAAADPRMVQLIIGSDADIVTFANDNASTLTFLDRVKSVIDTVKTDVGHAPLVIIYGRLKGTAQELSNAEHDLVSTFCAQEGWLFIPATTYAGGDFAVFESATDWAGNDQTHYDQIAFTDMTYQALERTGLLDYGPDSSGGGGSAEYATVQEVLALDAADKAISPDLLKFGFSNKFIQLQNLLDDASTLWDTVGDAGIKTGRWWYARTNTTAGNEASFKTKPGSAVNIPWTARGNEYAGRIHFGHEFVLSFSIALDRSSTANGVSVFYYGGAAGWTVSGDTLASKSLAVRIEDNDLYAWINDGTTTIKTPLGVTLNDAQANVYPRFYDMAIHSNGDGTFDYYFDDLLVGDDLAGPSTAVFNGGVGVHAYNGSDDDYQSIAVFNASLLSL